MKHRIGDVWFSGTEQEPHMYGDMVIGPADNGAPGYVWVRGIRPDGSLKAFVDTCYQGALERLLVKLAEGTGPEFETSDQRPSLPFPKLNVEDRPTYKQYVAKIHKLGGLT